jgi:hypothetical protein
MCERGFGCIFFFAAITIASQCSAQSVGNEAHLSAGRMSAVQRRDLSPTAPPFEIEKTCTYRGGPKTGIWSCQ